MKAKRLLTSALAVIFIATAAQGDTIPAATAHRMLMEGDSYLQAQPDAWQRRIETALRHALKGDRAELEAVRAERRAPRGEKRPEVEERDIVLERAIEWNAMPDTPITARLYRPAGVADTLPLLVYMVGDLWGVGSFGGAAEFCRDLAATGRLGVLALEQTQVPEVFFTVGEFEGNNTIVYALEHAAELGFDPDKVFIGGEGGGGNEAASYAYRAQSYRPDLKDDKLYSHMSKMKPSRGVVLISPVLQTDKYQDFPSRKKYGRTYGLDADLMEAAMDAQYQKGRFSEFMSYPLMGEGSLRKMSPVLLLSPERDILFDEGTKYVEALTRDGVAVQRVVLPGAVYGAAGTDGQPTARAEIVRRIVDFIDNIK